LMKVICLGYGKCLPREGNFQLCFSQNNLKIYNKGGFLIVF